MIHSIVVVLWFGGLVVLGWCGYLGYVGIRAHRLVKLDERGR